MSAPRYSCGKCGRSFLNRSDKCRHKQSCNGSTCSFDAGSDEIGDEDIYAHPRPAPPKWLQELHDREWDAIPSDPAELSVWMKGEPINLPGVQS